MVRSRSPELWTQPELKDKLQNGPFSSAIARASQNWVSGVSGGNLELNRKKHALLKLQKPT
ncbi:hypothetical protein [Oryza sativa Japonica Group]|uniref:Uncharacterized protein P0690B02.25 n=1 Tax=Oryza sativa subsp. japonica TaxID=39947 RepID=Q5JMA7_ORYSJ|nr:hypothetical protein [Oryza sativa Japonica Group]